METKTIQAITEEEFIFFMENRGAIEVLKRYGFFSEPDGFFEIQKEGGHIKNMDYRKHLYSRRKTDQNPLPTLE